METVQVPKKELEWLIKCSDVQMGDGDTARLLASKWLSNQSAIDEINEIQIEYGN